LNLKRFEIGLKIDLKKKRKKRKKQQTQTRNTGRAHPFLPSLFFSFPPPARRFRPTAAR
jgi:hypothetical protein